MSFQIDWYEHLRSVSGRDYSVVGGLVKRDFIKSNMQGVAVSAGSNHICVSNCDLLPAF